jgi:hypothetical protein
MHLAQGYRVTIQRASSVTIQICQRMIWRRRRLPVNWIDFDTCERCRYFVFELVFLGTSASAPSVQRGLSSALVMANEHRFMIDCGEGTQRQLLRTGLGFRRLDKILLTHGHLDHILGLGGLASHAGALGGAGGTQHLRRRHDAGARPHA